MNLKIIKHSENWMLASLWEERWRRGEMGRGEMEESCRGEETAACRGEMEVRRAAEERKLHHAVEIRGEQQRSQMEERRAADGRGSCITQRRAAEELDGGEEKWRRAADEGGGPEAASRCGDQRRASEELDGGEERWRRGELQMRDEDRKLHHAVESSARERDGERRNGGEETAACRGEEAASRSGELQRS